ncbi:ATPase [Spirochaetia bacterium]|nr:ATPase [Spirochaetia bacterium]
MFVGREKELDNLNTLYTGSAFELAVFYGRRRVGKTSLITEFIKDKPAVFFTARETNAAENLTLLSNSIQSSRYEAGQAPVFRTFDDALDHLFSIAENKRYIFVIDEYPYLAEAWQGISSALQEKIDHRSEKCKLFLILCGSSMSFMENQVLGYKSPLYGRRTAQYRIEAFSFFEAREFFPGMNPFDVALIYAIAGGIPTYLNLFTGKGAMKDKVMTHLLSPSGFLFEEPENLLKQELREPARYNAVIREIAYGSTRLSDIASQTGLETGTVSHLLDTLMQLGIVEREIPVTETARRGNKSIYIVTDNLYQFWYRFIPGLIDIIQLANPEKAWEFIEEGLTAYMGRIFEDICRQYLWRENAAERLPFFFQKAGRWWGNDPLRHATQPSPKGEGSPLEESEIDIIAIRGKSHALFCECKWKNAETGRDVLDALVMKAEHFHFEQKFFRLFSKAPFSAACKKAAEEMGNVKLVTFKEMCKEDISKIP